MFDTTGFEGVPHSIVFNGVERLHEVNSRKSHFDTPTPGISVESPCTSLSDLALGTYAGTLPDLRIEFVQAWDKSLFFRTVENSLYSAGEVLIGR